MAKDSQRKRGVILGYANIIVRNVVNLLYVPLLLAFVGQAEFGVYQTAFQFIASLQLISFGFSAAYIRFYTLRKVEGDEKGIRSLNGMYLLLYLAICGLAIVLGLIFSALCPQFFSEGFTASEVELVQILMVIMTFNIAVTLMSTVFDANVAAHEKFVFQQVCIMVTTILMPLLAWVLLLLGTGTIGAALAQLATNLLWLLINARYAVRNLSMRFEIKSFDFSLFKALAFFSSWIFLNQITDMISMNLPSVVLGAISGAATVAVFAVAMQLRSLFYAISSALSSVFIPLVNQIVAESNDNTKLTKLMTRVGRYQAMLYCWVLGGFILLGKWFVSVWAGESFVDAYGLTIIMASALFVPLVQNVGIEIQRAKNLHKARSFVYLLSSLGSLVVIWILANRFGYWAAAIGFSLYIVIGPWIFMNWYYQIRVGLNMVYFWRRMMPIVFAGVGCTALCVFGCNFAPVEGIVSFLLWGVSYTLLYGVAIWMFALAKDEKGALAKRFPCIKR